VENPTESQRAEITQLLFGQPLRCDTSDRIDAGWTLAAADIKIELMSIRFAEDRARKPDLTHQALL